MMHLIELILRNYNKSVIVSAVQDAVKEDLHITDKEKKQFSVFLEQVEDIQFNYKFDQGFRDSLLDCSDVNDIYAKVAELYIEIQEDRAEDDRNQTWNDRVYEMEN